MSSFRRTKWFWQNEGSHEFQETSAVGGADLKFGTYLNSDGTFQTKVEQNLFKNNNESAPASGAGIYSDVGALNMLIDANKFVGHTSSGIMFAESSATGSNITMSNNEFDSNHRGFFLLNVTSSAITGNTLHDSTDSATADIRIFGGVSDLSITCNKLTDGAGRAIRINDGIGSDPNSDITINNNNISGYAGDGLVVDSGSYRGSLEAMNNWWGSATGPTNPGNPGGTGQTVVDADAVVDFTPFLTTAIGLVCPPPPSVCGNGVQEGGEACDLGVLNGTTGACCTASCAFVPASTMCRPAADVCDVAEFCTGSSASCPADTFAPNGTQCNDHNKTTCNDMCSVGSCVGTSC